MPASRWLLRSLWEYWDFEFRRIVLRAGWELDEWNYNKYLLAGHLLTSR